MVYAKLDEMQEAQTQENALPDVEKRKLDQVVEKLEGNCVSWLFKEEGEFDRLRIQNNAIKHTIEIIIPDTNADYLEACELTANGEAPVGMESWYEEGESHIQVTLNSVYECELEQRGKKLIVRFFKPKEKYDKVVTIDAGHGGKHPGAIVGDVFEKEITLGVVQKLKALLDSTEIKVYYTRLDDSNPSLEERVGLANESESDLFLSVHVNADTTSAASSGVEALYRIEDTDREFTSRDFAEICIEETSKQLGVRKRTLVSDESICVVRNAIPPVALVEIGFITNTQERKRMVTKEYQEQAANALYESILQAYTFCGQSTSQTH